MYRLYRWALSLAVVAAAACAEPTEQESVPSNIALDNTPTCLPGCTETDPFPDSAGVYLSSFVTPLACFEGTSTDADLDGMVDRCERDLAQAFAPQLFHYKYDDVRREPYWVANGNTWGWPAPLYAGGGDVRIVYLLSYYEDLGSSSAACVPPFSGICAPHHGDSEWIALDLYYKANTKHWLLKGALLSQHEGAFGVPTPSGQQYPTAFFYPGKAGTYPRVWVAQGKHANYTSRNSCNSGAQFNTDTCVNNNTAVRVEYSGAYNLGSRSMPLKNCVVSRNPTWQWYGTGKTECYWNDGDVFRAWYPDNIGGGSSGYHSDILEPLGF
jgi:hypothetical protein